MMKKPYTPPAVNKVILKPKNAILGFYSSPNLFPKSTGCTAQVGGRSTKTG